MIHVDESDPIGDLELSFAPRDVIIKRGVDAKDAYEMVTEIGRGKFGTVYRCREKATGLQLAAKFVPMPKRDDRRNAEREVELMNSLQHTLIIQLYDALEYQKMMCVVLELVEGGELFDRVIDDDFVLTERACAVFVRQVCQAMEFVHRNNIIHLDLKPENILCLTREGNRIKIIDFGLARKFDPDKKLQVLFGTPEFVAPEVVNFDQISFGTDMWSVGVICYVLLSGLSPFMGGTDVETMANVTIGKYDFDDEAFAAVSKDALDFIGKLLVKDSSVRLTAAQCLAHKWLKRRTAGTKTKSTKHKSGIAQTADGQQVRRKSSTGSESAAKEEAIASSKNASTATTATISSNNGTDNDVDNSNSNNNNSNANGVPNALTSPSPDSREENGNGNESAINSNTINTELKATKDNLKSFIERWEEHPNSPYVFDTDAHCISPVFADTIGDAVVAGQQQPDEAMMMSTVSLCNGGSSSVLSSRGCSPSPCESLGSDLLPNSLEDCTPPPPPLPATQPPCTTASSATQPFHQPPFHSGQKQTHIREYLQCFERRHSDSICVPGAQPSASYEKVNLADEIKRLSERLMMLSSLTPVPAATSSDVPDVNDAGDQRRQAADDKPALKPKPEYLKNKTRTTMDEQFAQQLAQHTDAVTTKRKAFQRSTRTTATTSTTTTTSERTFTRATSVVNTRCTASSSLRSDRLSARLQLLDDMPTINNRRPMPTTTTTPQADCLSDTSGYESTASFFGRTIDRNGSFSGSLGGRRTKFRVSQMSRDVPIGSPETHRTVFLEEAVTNTKDCLLQLLDKYNGGRGSADRSDAPMNGSERIAYMADGPPEPSSGLDRRSAFGRQRGRHQSLSFGAGCGSGSSGAGITADSVEQRSMNSLNFFFQRHAVAGSQVRQMQAQLESRKRQS